MENFHTLKPKARSLFDISFFRYIDTSLTKDHAQCPVHHSGGRTLGSELFRLLVLPSLSALLCDLGWQPHCAHAVEPDLAAHCARKNQSSPRPGPGGEKTNVHTAMTTPDRGNDHSVQAQYNGSAHSLVQLVVWALDMECCGMWSLVVELYLMSTIFFCRTASLAAFTSHSLPQGGAEHDLCFTNPELLRFRRAATEPLKSRPQLLAICTIDR